MSEDGLKTWLKTWYPYLDGISKTTRRAFLGFIDRATKAYNDIYIDEIHDLNNDGKNNIHKDMDIPPREFLQRMTGKNPSKVYTKNMQRTDTSYDAICKGQRVNRETLIAAFFYMYVLEAHKTLPVVLNHSHEDAPEIDKNRREEFKYFYARLENVLEAHSMMPLYPRKPLDRIILFSMRKSDEYPADFLHDLIDVNNTGRTS